MQESSYIFSHLIFDTMLKNKWAYTQLTNDKIGIFKK